MVNRRDFLRTIAAGSVCGILGSSFALGKGQRDSRPNVILLIADDMNDYGFYRTYSGVKTPYLETFKKSALTFERAYCGSPVCTPSRAALFSGLYPHTTGAYRNGCDPWRTSELLKRIETLPECFKRNGYETFGRGKLYHAKLTEGREEKNWDNKPVYKGGFGPFPEEKDQQISKFFSYNAWEGPDTDFPDVKNSRAVMDFLKQEHEKPFFVTFGLWRPHTPFTAPKRFFDIYDIDDIPNAPPGYSKDDLNDVPVAGKKLVDISNRFKRVGAKNVKLWREFVRGYFACTTFADWSIGQVLEALAGSKYADNTIVIFCSDNGFHCGEKSHWGKGTLWEQAARCPAMIRVLGTKSVGKVCKRPVSFVDFYPTLVYYCKLTGLKHELEGESLRPLLDDPDADWDRPAITTYGENYLSMRDYRFRYIQYPNGNDELYNYQKDPHELVNLAGKKDYQEVKNKFIRWMPKKWAKTLGGREG